MADRPTTTRAAAPPAGGKKTIAGVDQKTFFIVGGLALGAGLLYFYFKGKKTQGQGQGQGKRQAPASPTGLTREHLVFWIQDHGGHKHHGR